MILRFLEALALSGALFVLSCSGPASAGEGWESRPRVCNAEEIKEPALMTRCRNWIANVQRPDEDGACCGEADAYIADAFRRDGDNYYAIITRDYPAITSDDGEGGTSTGPSVPLGTEVLIPPEKLNRAFKDGNPTGHGIVFMRSNGDVLCYFGPSLS